MLSSWYIFNDYEFKKQVPISQKYKTLFNSEKFIPILGSQIIRIYYKIITYKNICLISNRIRRGINIFICLKVTFSRNFHLAYIHTHTQKEKNMLYKNKQRNSCHNLQKHHPPLSYMPKSGPPLSVLQN